MIGLMGLGNNGTLYAPNGAKLVKLPLRLAMLLQRTQHWIALKSWK